ncbi:MAG: WS/DGAT/MGAT family O-acyltransferase [Jatrophihabitans sp.]|uniref:WS/DGAT/MGAT family O-acyltransferase n=1 Tax=Jatrophihabitans sp. TaxID=1932789 RepID=UPI003F81E626
MTRLSGLDASFLYFETSAHLMHVCGLLMPDATTIPGGYEFESIRARMGARLGANPSFRRKLHNPLLNLDHPVWIDDPDFDIEHHVRRATAAAPGGREQVAAVCNDIAGQPLDRSKPLWEFWFIEGLPDDRLGVFTKMHHAMVDGVSGASLVAELCSLGPDEPPIKPAEPVPVQAPPSDAAIVLDGLANIARRPLHLAKILPGTLSVLPRWIDRARGGRAMPAPFTAPRTSFNGTVTGHRTTAWARLSLEDVKEIKRAFGCTVNDVVLALCAGALRRYLDDRGELPDAPLLASVPVSVHGRTGGGGTNKVSSMFTKLATDVADPAERLAVIAGQTKVSKEHHGTISASMLQDWAQFAPAATIGLGVRMYAALRMSERHPVIHNLVVSNVPGPPMAIYLLGAKVLDFHPFGPILHGAGLNITVISYDGHVDVGLIACREQAPDLWSLADDMAPALQELVDAARAKTATAPADVTTSAAPHTQPAAPV